MIGSRWHAHRMGLVDFWFYEDEVFMFDHGHMLLRGSNGSGKSVTMQSFIPLLLDGNKASERIDAFGSKSRRLDTYLIDENTNRDERIGYLYLEFKRQESDLYKTIGMGLRARKGKPLESWYFVIEDGRRIGIDIQLSNSGLTITKKQLKNIIGDQLIESQKAYAAKVNDALFGFETVGQYLDLISLLIQVRQPKLSNSLTPKNMNDLLSNSLQPLSEEDLLPMSDSIAHMDGLQDELDALRQSLDAAKKIDEVYMQYNAILLAEKEQLYRKENSKLSQLKNEYATKQQKMDEAKKQLEDYQTQAHQLDLTKQSKENELSTINIQDLEAMLLRKEELEKDLVKQKEAYDRKSIKLERLDDRYQSLKIKTKQNEDHLYRCLKTLDELIEGMEDYQETLQLPEITALSYAYHHQTDFEFDYTKKVIQEAKKKIDSGISTFKSYQNEHDILVKKQEEEAKTQNTLQQLEQQLDQKEKEYQSCIEAMIEWFYAYDSQNQLLKITNVLPTIRTLLINYENNRNFIPIAYLVTHCFQTISQDLILKHNQATLTYRTHEQALEGYKEEMEALLSQEDVAPVLDEPTLANRDYLQEAKIPYKPLYQLLDFKEGLIDELKNQYEALLTSMHLLNAVVVEEKYQYQTGLLPSHAGDHYLWTTKKIKDLDVVLIESLDTEEDLYQLFHQLGIDNEDDLSLSPRYFKSGMIEGSYQVTKPATYIGYQTRLAYKQKQIEQLEEKIAHEKTMLLEANEVIKELTNKQALLKEEFEAMTNDDALKQVLVDIDYLKMNHKKLFDQLQAQALDIQNIQRELHVKFKQLAVLSSELMIDHDYDAFIYYQSQLLDFEADFFDFKNTWKDYQRLVEKNQTEQESFIEVEEAIDELNAELSMLIDEQQLKQSQLDTLTTHFKSIGYEQLMVKVSTIKKEIQDLQYALNELSTKQVALTTSMAYLEEQRDALNDQVSAQQAVTEDFKSIYEQEKQLGLVPEGFKMTSKKNRDDITSSLTQVFYYQSTFLTNYDLFQELLDLPVANEHYTYRRMILKATHQGQRISFATLIKVLEEGVLTQEVLVKAEDRHIFEEVLLNTVWKKIREKIQTSRNFVSMIQRYMDQMNISNGLALSLKWKAQKAIDDDQLDISTLVALLERDYHVLKESDLKKISNHFRSKINEARKLSLDEHTTASFNQLMHQVMDYRQWFTFTLYAKKPGEQVKELTTHLFNSYSGGEKAIAMYVPLFSAVAAKFSSAKEDAPMVIALDEAFAGVDQNNIDNMFKLIEKFGFDYIMNSQILWGDYPSCRHLAIYELYRDVERNFITTIAYLWNGKEKRMVR